MPRDGSGVYSLPFPDVVTATPIASTVFNGFEHDIATDLNAPRPIVAGGTGASSAAAARAALTAEAYGQIVTNYDSYSFLPGSFYSDSAATSPPVVGHAFVGICAFVDGNNMYLEAYDRDDAAQPGALWVRQKKAGVWSSWAKSQALNIVGTPAANAFTTWQSSTALQAVAITGLVKGNGASAPAAAAAGTDYAPATSGSSILKGNGSGGFSNAVAGTDYPGPPANPTASIGLTAVNGSANTGMRSDAAPALSQAITPTWSGAHIFNGTVAFNAQTTATTQTANDNSTKLATTAYADAAATLRDYIAGLTLSTAGGSASFSVAAGSATDSTNVNLMKLASALTKTTSAWAVGSGNGGLDTGAIANNTWYHVHLIKRPDTGVVDVLVSLSATAPTMPTNYTLRRRIGAMRTNASAQWTAFTQINDKFWWSVPIGDANILAVGITRVLLTLSVPTGVSVDAITATAFANSTAGTSLWFGPTFVPDAAPVLPGLFSIFNGASTSASVSGGQQTVTTDTSGQIAVRSNNASSTFYLNTHGWIDTRGKEA